MKVSLSWLSCYVDINVPVDELCEKMVSVGFEVEEVINLADGIFNVVVGEIISIANHPNADKLKICKVNVGSTILQIVTGASNIKVSNKVPIALDNSTLPNGKKISSGLLRGELSQGMMCSGSELKITDAVYNGAGCDGILILDESETNGADIVDVLGLRDYCLDFSITSNRPDCNSVYGIATEVAAVLGTKVRPLDLEFTSDKSDNINKYLSVEVSDKQLCPYYSTAVIKNIKIAPSPRWLTRRLASVGHKSINNLVDITNYILLLLGHPMHAFDYKDINDKKILIRRAANKEQIIPFDEKTYTLDKDTLLIADKRKAVGIAGIMGGLNSGIKTDTTTVAFESAVFNRENIRRSSKRLGLKTDASACYSKGTNKYTADLALRHALHLVYKLQAGTVVSGEIIVDNSVAVKNSVSFDYSDISKLLGIEIDPQISIKILNALNISSKIINRKMNCIIPAYRSDISSGCDIAEEIIRYYGYDNIKSSLLTKASVTQGGKNDKRKQSDKLKSILTGLGYSEIATYSFVGEQLYNKLNRKSDGLIKIINPLGEEVSLMRDTLIANMLNTLSTNYNRKNTSVLLYEYSRIYQDNGHLPDKLPIETNFVSIGGLTDFYTIKNAVEQIARSFSCKFDYKRTSVNYLHSGMAADIYCNNTLIGYAGIIHPEIAVNFNLSEETCVCELNFDLILNYSNNSFVYKHVPKFPQVSRDIAIVVDKEVEVASLINCVYSASSIVENVSLLSIYNDEKLGNNNSVALSITMQLNDRTLTELEVEDVMKQILKQLGSFNAKLR